MFRTVHKRSSRGTGNSVFHPIPRDGKSWLRLGFVMLVGTAMLLFLRTVHVGCAVRWAIHIPCPGCGLTRAYLALFRGDVGAAFRWHFMFPSVLIVFPLILYDGKLFQKETWNRWLLAILFAGFLLRWILNLTGVLPA